jgi:2-polyprenyl-3-methyl-5-hydroxy-6-metoxy-1,4-benzoquinol methylase
MMSTLLPDELTRFNRLAATWWDSEGPMRPLHVVNALRRDLLLDQIAQHLGRPSGDLHGVRVADIGCGAGLICEPLAVGAEPNLSHRADRILSQGWKPTLRGSAVDKCSS